MHIKIITLFIINCCCICSIAQESKSEKISKYGFYVGLDQHRLIANGREKGQSLESNGIGISIGIIGEHKLTSNFLISPKMEVSFLQNNFFVFYNNDMPNRYDISPFYTTIKSDFIYKFNGSNTRYYFLLGPSYSFAVNKEIKPDEFPSGNTFSISAGIGIDKKLSFFDIAPELRYSYGLSNMDTNPAFNGDLNWNRISLVVYFKG